MHWLVKDPGQEEGERAQVEDLPEAYKVAPKHHSRLGTHSPCWPFPWPPRGLLEAVGERIAARYRFC